MFLYIVDDKTVFEWEVEENFSETSESLKDLFLSGDIFSEDDNESELDLEALERGTACLKLLGQDRDSQTFEFVRSPARNKTVGFKVGLGVSSVGSGSGGSGLGNAISEKGNSFMNLRGLTARACAAAKSGAQTGAAEILADQVRAIVVGRLPAAVKVWLTLVPNSVLNFAISFAVQGVADSFNIPGRDRVRDTAQYAMQGAAHNATQVLLGFITPIVQEILRLNPEGAIRLGEEAAE